MRPSRRVRGSPCPSSTSTSAGGVWAHLTARDVHRAKVFGRCEHGTHANGTQQGPACDRWGPSGDLHDHVVALDAHASGVVLGVRPRRGGARTGILPPGVPSLPPLRSGRSLLPRACAQHARRVTLHAAGRVSAELAPSSNGKATSMSPFAPHSTSPARGRRSKRPPRTSARRSPSSSRRPRPERSPSAYAPAYS